MINDLAGKAFDSGRWGPRDYVMSGAGVLLVAVGFWDWQRASWPARGSDTRLEAAWDAWDGGWSVPVLFGVAAAVFWLARSAALHASRWAGPAAGVLIVLAMAHIAGSWDNRFDWDDMHARADGNAVVQVLVSGTGPPDVLAALQSGQYQVEPGPGVYAALALLTVQLLAVTSLYVTSLSLPPPRTGQA
jgi:hypothetical protein